MTTFETATRYATEFGAEEGKAAAAWYFDGNTTTETYRRVLQGMDEGDPEVLDTLPLPDLSGQWADGRTYHELARECGIDADADEYTADDVANAYENAFTEAAHGEIERVARHMLDDDAHDARPDDLPEPGDRCKDCGADIYWVGPSTADWQHVDA